MAQVLSTFGIDWRLLIVNAVNFALVLLALWYFLYAPVMKMLEERRQRVAQGVRDAQAAAAGRAAARAAGGGVLAAAGKEADQVMAAARAAGTAKERELAQKGEAAAALAVREAQARAEGVKARAIEEGRQEGGKLIFL